MSNVTQDVLLQAFNQGLGYHSNLDGRFALPPAAIINSYTPVTSKPVTFAAFTPMQLSLMASTRSAPLLRSSAEEAAANSQKSYGRTCPPGGYGVL